MSATDVPSPRRIPVIGLTGYLGAGKTTVLNHLLRRPGARVGVVVNDFGAINVDAALVVGQVDEAASIAGGCVCCLPDAGGLDDALVRLTRPRLRLDAVIVEASGVADPRALARLIRFSGAERVRPGGIVDVVDAVEHHRTVGAEPGAGSRYAAATLVLLNKTDRVSPTEGAELLGGLVAQVRQVDGSALVLATSHGRVDPALVYDAASHEAPPDELPLATLGDGARPGEGGGHRHATTVTVLATGPVEPGALIDLLESPPRGVYRLKGCVPVRTARAERRYLVNLVGRGIYVQTAPRAGGRDGLVAVGPQLDVPMVRRRLRTALCPTAGVASAAGLRRLQRHRRLSV